MRQCTAATLQASPPKWVPMSCMAVQLLAKRESHRTVSTSGLAKRSFHLHFQISALHCIGPFKGIGRMLFLVPHRGLALAGAWGILAQILFHPSCSYANTEVGQ